MRESFVFKWLGGVLALCALSGCHLEDTGTGLDPEDGIPARDFGMMADLGGRPDQGVPRDMMTARDLSPASDLPVMTRDQGDDAGSDQAPSMDMAPEEMSMMPPDMMLPVEDMSPTMPKCGNAKVEAGELCDGDCPTSCNDNDACTMDVLAGSPSTCNAVCSYPAISACTSGDGCCPSGCDYKTDGDCPTPVVACDDEGSWDSTWLNEANTARSQLNGIRTSGSCAGMSYPPQAGLSNTDKLRNVARCMVAWHKANSPVNDTQITNQFNAELARLNVTTSARFRFFSEASTLAQAKDLMLNTSQLCSFYTSSNYSQIGVAYADPSFGSNAHVFFLVLARP